MRKFFSMFLISTMALSFVGCGGADDSAKDGSVAQEAVEVPTIGVCIYKYDDNFMSYTRQAIEKAAEGKAELIMNDSQNDQAKQNDQIDTMIAKGVDSLMVNLVDPGAAPAVVEKAKNAGIPIILFNKEYQDGTHNLDYDKVWYVGTTSEESGIIQGEVVLDAWNANPSWDKNGDGTMQYVMLMGEPGHPDAEARTEWVVKTIEEAGVPTEELGTQTAMWDAAQAKNMMETWLAANGDEIEIVFSNNDGMAMGAIEALKSEGYFEGDKYMPVIGIDALPEALVLIENGQLMGTVLNDPLGQGKASLELAINAALGIDVLTGTEWVLDETKAVRVPYVGITTENIAVAEEAYGL
ncbi:galactose ABC transporter substrate-binding protein [Candidatus Epulonipiscium fishelsonii]|uniref:Galactose ABC transporter substrate-binding protein n=1 Tax=Candidatus Epulonipiscium fishelsonii TaxID=77094 RepID=A0ACC8XJ89_9FIRM|nr:galactose ABC transporter substrate-binding protein [Epulopiscium sp. SCG-D08WGA-EpuloA1]